MDALVLAAKATMIEDASRAVVDARAQRDRASARWSDAAAEMAVCESRLRRAQHDLRRLALPRGMPST